MKESLQDFFGLNGKVAIVTGGNGGIGLGIARGLAAAGADIVIAARNEAKSEKVASAIKSDFGVKALCLNVDMKKLRYIQCYGIPEDGCFDPELLKEF